VELPLFTPVVESGRPGADLPSSDCWPHARLGNAPSTLRNPELD
jgi:hypothetical protein